MNKKILIALLSLTMLTASKCEEGVPQDLVFESPLCADTVTGFTFAILKYGDGLMSVLPVTRVREGRMFVVLLAPESGFRKADVTISGDGDAAWINGSGTYNGLPAGTFPRDGMLEAGCAPELPDGVDSEEYKYMIEVHDADSGVKNTLDPLVRVEK